MDVVIMGCLFGGMLFAMIYLPLKMIEALAGICNVYNDMIDHASGRRRPVPQKRPMSDNNTTPIPKDPHYK